MCIFSSFRYVTTSLNNQLWIGHSVAATVAGNGFAITFAPNTSHVQPAANQAGLYAFDIGSTNVTPFAVDEADNRQQLVPYAAAVTLGVGVTTFNIEGNLVTVTGDGGANTIATITGGYAGKEITLLFVDALVTITDTDAHTANTVDLSAAFTSADDTILKLIHNGVSWYEVSRSVN